MNRYDVCVIGSGLAGVSTALSLNKNLRVALVTKKALEDSNSYLAQGGINILKDPSDRETFIEDTLKAGHYKNTKASVEKMVDQSPEAIQFLIDLGVEFSKKNGQFDYGREGGHSIARGLHIDDEVGKNILDVLYKRLEERENIDVFEHEEALDLLVHKNKCYGVQTDRRIFYSTNVVLATGGLGGLFDRSTNFSHIRGDGLAMALRHQVAIKDISYIQFHPTSLYEEEADRQFLISESVRGEGALLLNHEDRRFIDELKPRDIVAQAIFKEMKREDVAYEYLSMEKIGKEKIPRRFPMIFQELMDRGVDPRASYVKIIPCQHYTMGGIACDQYGRTSMEGLFAVGEAGNVGIHGSNRLACNSLLECVVFGRLLGAYLNGHLLKAKDFPGLRLDFAPNPEDDRREIFERIEEDEKIKAGAN